MTKNYLQLEQISEKFRDLHDGYTERNITYVCPCGNGTILWSKERPSGVNGATFSDVFCYCDECEGKYDFNSRKGYAVKI